MSTHMILAPSKVVNIPPLKCCMLIRETGKVLPFLKKDFFDGV